MKFLSLLISLILLVIVQVRSQSFEGYVNKKYPVWMDIRIRDAFVIGSYFYKTVGKNISLAGTRRGDSLYLYERSGGMETGIFSCVLKNGTIQGRWSKSVKQKGVEVDLTEIDSSFRKYSVIPRWRELLLFNGHSMEQEIASFSVDDHKKAKPRIEYFSKAVLGLFVEYNTGAFNQFIQRDPYLFDLITKRQILLADEISDGKKAGLTLKVENKINDRLALHKLKFSTKKWLDVFNGDTIKMRQSFHISDLSSEALNNCRIEEDGIYIYVTESFSLPDAARTMWMKEEIFFSFEYLKPYLKDSSCLRRLFYSL